jgi:hypothetical protein
MDGEKMTWHVPRHNPSFCPEKRGRRMSMSGWLPKDCSLPCFRPCTCDQCKILYVDEMTFASKTYMEKLEEVIHKIIFIIGFPYFYFRAIMLGVSIEDA